MINRFFVHKRLSESNPQRLFVELLWKKAKGGCCGNVTNRLIYTGCTGIRKKNMADSGLRSQRKRKQAKVQTRVKHDKPQMCAYVHTSISNEQNYIRKNSEDKMPVIKCRILDQNEYLSGQNAILVFIVLCCCVWVITDLIEMNMGPWLCLSLRSTDIWALAILNIQRKPTMYQECKSHYLKCCKH